MTSSPIRSDFHTAWETFLHNPYNFWPRRKNVSETNHRLEPFPQINSQSIHLKPTDQLISIGSCFAYSVLTWLNYIGVPSINQQYRQIAEPLYNEYWTNIYTPGVLLEFVQMAHEVYTTGDLSPNSLQLGVVKHKDSAQDKLYSDLMFTIEREAEADTLENILAKRKHYFTHFLAKIFDADCIILTLGLIESWYDTKYKGYINRTPKMKIYDEQPERFEFRVLRFQENLELLQKIVDTILTTGNKHKKILLTVSPVPLLATFRDKDILTANMYSKSILRGAVEELIFHYPNVHYFPSYEMVMYTNKQELWANDLRHIQPKYIVQIMKNFFHHNFNKADFPFLKLQTLSMQILVELHSETTEAPDNKERNINVGNLSTFPTKLAAPIITLCKRVIDAAQRANINPKHRDLLFLQFVVTMHLENFSKEIARKQLTTLVELDDLPMSLQSALAGYALTLDCPDITLQLIEPLVKRNEEPWQYYHQVSLAYYKKKNAQKAVDTLLQCLQQPVKWIMLDTRSVEYLSLGVHLAKLLHKPYVAFTFTNFAISLKPHDLSLWEQSMKLLQQMGKTPQSINDGILNQLLQQFSSPQVEQLIASMFHKPHS